MGRRAVIAGCGIAGPAVGLFMRRAGWEPVIYEAVEHPDAEAGVFLNLATNGLAVLDQLGLREQLLAGAHRCPTMVTNPIAISIRDLIVPMFLRKAASDTTNQWIYDYRVGWAA